MFGLKTSPAGGDGRFELSENNESRCLFDIDLGRVSTCGAFANNKGGSIPATDVLKMRHFTGPQSS